MRNTLQFNAFLFKIDHYKETVYEITSFFLIVYIMRIKENTFSYSFRMLNVLHLHYSNLIYLYKKLIDRYNIYFPFLFCEYYLCAKHHFISHVFFFSNPLLKHYSLCCSLMTTLFNNLFVESLLYLPTCIKLATHCQFVQLRAHLEHSFYNHWLSISWSSFWDLQYILTLFSWWADGIICTFLVPCVHATNDKDWVAT